MKNKDQTFINEAIKQYKNKLYRIINICEKKEISLNLDKMEYEFRKAYLDAENKRNIQKKELKQYASYQEDCGFKDELNNSLDNIDNLIFGIKDSCGVVIGYDYSIDRAIKNKELLKI